MGCLAQRGILGPGPEAKWWGWGPLVLWAHGLGTLLVPSLGWATSPWIPVGSVIGIKGHLNRLAMQRDPGSNSVTSSALHKRERSPSFHFGKKIRGQ